MSVAHPERVALQKRFDAFPLATHDTGETVLAAGSKTGRLLILRKGATARPHLATSSASSVCCA
jgi:hypothetical protein